MLHRGCEVCHFPRALIIPIVQVTSVCRDQIRLFFVSFCCAQFVMPRSRISTDNKETKKECDKGEPGSYSKGVLYGCSKGKSSVTTFVQIGAQNKQSNREREWKTDQHDEHWLYLFI